MEGNTDDAAATWPMIGAGQRAFDLATVIDDDREFRQWYDLVAPRVYAYLFSRTGSAAVAEDLTQETFIEVVRNPRSYDGRRDPLPWLIGVARHRLARHFQRVRRDADRGVRLVQSVADDPHQEAPWRAVEAVDSLRTGLDALPAEQRAALLLRFADGLTIREVAATIGRSEDATESLVRRAREAFEKAERRGGR